MCMWDAELLEFVHMYVYVCLYVLECVRVCVYCMGVSLSIDYSHQAKKRKMDEIHTKNFSL